MESYTMSDANTTGLPSLQICVLALALSKTRGLRDVGNICTAYNQVASGRSGCELLTEKEVEDQFTASSHLFARSKALRTEWELTPAGQGLVRTLESLLALFSPQAQVAA